MMNKRRNIRDRRKLPSAGIPPAPMQRRWQVAVVAALLLSAGSILLAALLFARAGKDALAACERANNVRAALNVRTPLHKADTDYLIDLTRALAQNRQREARVLLRLGRKYGIKDDLDELATIYRETGKRGRRILKGASRISFRHVDIPDCEEVVKSG